MADIRKLAHGEERRTAKRQVGLAGLAGAAMVALGFSATDASALTCLNDPDGQTDCNVALVVGNDTLVDNGFTGPYISGNIHWNSATSVTVSFQSLTQTIGSNTYQFRFGDLAFNLAHLGDDDVTIEASNLSFDGNLTPPPESPFGADPFKTEPPDSLNYPAVFGDINAWLQQSPGYPSAVTSIEFDLTIDGATWAGADSVLELNSEGHSAVAHIYVAQCVDAQCTSYAQTSEGRGDIEVSGYATWPGDTNVIPEPAMLGLFGLGLLGLGLARRRLVLR